MQEQEFALVYNLFMRRLSEMLEVDEWQERANGVLLLGLQAKGKVLEVGSGTGSNLPFLSAAVGDQGQVVALDLCPHMIRQSKKLWDKDLEILHLRGNALDLPFPDKHFDCVLHAGMINQLDRAGRRRALREAARVVKAGGVVIVSDEGVAPWLKRTEVSRKLIEMLPSFDNSPPLEDLPLNAINVKVNWLFGGAFWIVRLENGPLEC